MKEHRPLPIQEVHELRALQILFPVDKQLAQKLNLLDTQLAKIGINYPKSTKITTNAKEKKIL